MQKIYKIITQLISSAITGASPDIKHEDIDFKTVFEIGESLGISALIGYALFKSGLMQNNEYSAHFKNVQMLAMFRYMQGESETSNVCKIFDVNEINYIPLKGSVIADYYPEKHLRTKSDIDILIKKDNAEQATELLVNHLGYEKGETNGHDISFFSKSGYHVELHFSLTDGDESIDKILSEVWDNSFSKNDKPHHFYMSNEFFALYHTVHMAKHFINGGCGVKPIVDLWIIKNKMGYDEEKLILLLEECKLKKFYDEISYLSKVWFEGMPHTDTSEKAENFLFKAGAYGSLENHVAIAQYKNGGKSGYLLSKIFLSYKDMEVYYPSLNKLPFLYPLYQVRRWFKIAFFGGMTIAKEQIATSNSTTSDKLKEVSELIDKLGI